MSERLAEMTEGIVTRSRSAPLAWEVRDGDLHLVCPWDGQSVLRVNGGLSFTLDGAAVHAGAHLRQCHDEC